MKISLASRLAVLLCVLVLALSSCSNSDNKESKANKKDSSSSSTAQQGNTVTTLSQNEFTRQVQVVCNSVDPKVFDAILLVDPLKDKDFQSKFDAATKALGDLNTGFTAIKPEARKSAQWQRGLDSLSLLKSQVDLVSKQYSEYVALLAESETNKDPARTIAILSRLITLAGEYADNLKAINESFTKVLKVGNAAGISKCKAFEIGSSPK